MKKIAVLSFLILNIILILYFWASNSGSLLTQGIPLVLLSLGRLMGLLAAYFVLLQFLLIGRSPWIEKTFGLDKLSRIHRLNGKIVIFFILLHPTFLILAYSMTAKIGLLEQYFRFLNGYEDIFQASIAVILFTIIVFLSISITRKRLKYETWYFVHLFIYLAVFLSWGHQLQNGEDFLANKVFVFYWYALYIFVLGNHVLFRFLRPWYLFLKHRFFVQDIVHETNEVTSVIIGGRNLESFHIDAGQFMLLRFLTKNLWWQTHPFSLSKFPDGKTIRLSIKNVGDFTSLIPGIKKGAVVYIDGPYGIFTKEVVKKDKVLLIAGGIGITPVRSLLEQLVREKRDVVLIYSNRTKEEIVFKNEIDALQKIYTFPAYFFLSQEKLNGFQSGRVDGKKIQEFVNDVKDRDVFICGPVPMMESIKNDLMQLGVPKSQIHYEQFSL